MSLTTHRRAIGSVPSYGPSLAMLRERDTAGVPGAFRMTFRGAHTTRRPDEGAGRHTTSCPSGSAPWSAAFAILLVTNFVASANASLPRRFRAPDTPNWDASGHAAAPDTRWEGEVVAEPITRPSLKSHYSPTDLLRAVAAARMPFTSTGESMTDTYAFMTGREVSGELRKTVRNWASAIDFTTGLIPEVQVLRLPAEISDMAVDAIDGKALSPDRLLGLVQFASPRTSGSPDTARVEPQRPATTVEELPWEMPWDKQWEAPKEERAGTIGLPDNLANEKPTSRFAILGEFDHLDGYVQTFTQAELPEDKNARLVFVSGQRYLRGEAGYYRATHGVSGDHWLVDAPRQTRAQVPVTYDPATNQWRAHEPLRVCGGGCGSSRPMTPDSIATSFDDIFAATRHLPDEGAQEAIQNAFSDLSRLHLVRSNRADLRAMRDNSIVDHRLALRVAMKDIDRQQSLIKQQCQAAEVTARYYYSHPFAEAFCQENAEILFRFLMQDGIRSDQLRMITVQPKNRPPHVMVLYTESRRFIKMLEASTPHPRVSLQQDGISSGQFAWAAYMTRDTTLLLDPWSRNKAVSFAWAQGPQDIVDILEVAFADIGHRTGNPYTVSITRPLTSRRGTLDSQTSLGSLGSAASSGAVSGTSGTSVLSVSNPRLNAPARVAPEPRRASVPGDFDLPKPAQQPN